MLAVAVRGVHFLRDRAEWGDGQLGAMVYVSSIAVRRKYRDCGGGGARCPESERRTDLADRDRLDDNFRAGRHLFAVVRHPYISEPLVLKTHER